MHHYLRSDSGSRFVVLALLLCLPILTLIRQEGYTIEHEILPCMDDSFIAQNQHNVLDIHVALPHRKEHS